jgi:hypothetical protein
MRLGLGTSDFTTVEFGGGGGEYSANSIWPRRRVEFDTEEIRVIARKHHQRFVLKPMELTGASVAAKPIDAGIFGVLGFSSVEIVKLG